MPVLFLVPKTVVFAHRKSIDNLTPPKRAKNQKSQIHECPNIDLGVTFGDNFGIDFHEILDLALISRNHRNAYI